MASGIRGWRVSKYETIVLLERRRCARLLFYYAGMLSRLIRLKATGLNNLSPFGRIFL